MAEIYLFQLTDNKPVFTPSNAEVPEKLLDAHVRLVDLPNGMEIFAKMGDPDLIHCVIFRRRDNPGGIFAIHDRDELLFAAVTENNLTFAMACSHFGEMTSNTRYGVDVHEEFEEPND